MPVRRVLPAVAILFTNALGATIVIPILPLFAVTRLGATVFQAVLLESTYYGAKFLAAPLLGRLSDQHGRRPVLLFSQAGTAFSFLLFLLALPLGTILDGLPGWPGISGGLLVLYAARALDGASGGNTIVAQAYVADVTTDAQRAQALGWLSGTLGLGFVLGPAAGGLLAGTLGLFAPFAAGAVLAFLALVLAALFLVESLPQQPAARAAAAAPVLTMREIVRLPALQRLLLIGFLCSLCFAALSPTFTLYVDQVIYPGLSDPAMVGQRVGIMFTVIGLTMAITQGLLIKPLVRRAGETRLVWFSQAVMIAVFLAIPWSRDGLSFVALLLPFVMAYSVAEPSLQTLVSRLGEHGRQGQMFGLYHALTTLAYVIGPLWAGYVFANIAPQALWLVAALIMTPTLPLAWFLQRETPVPGVAQRP